MTGNAFRAPNTSPNTQEIIAQTINEWILLNSIAIKNNIGQIYSHENHH
jgi:hypothetical protein